MDPWMITPDERAMHAGQFGSLNPAAGFIDGNGARGFFMQSGLPPMVLAQGRSHSIGTIRTNALKFINDFLWLLTLADTSFKLQT